jgi:hypothetical protein
LIHLRFRAHSRNDRQDFSQKFSPIADQALQEFLLCSLPSLTVLDMADKPDQLRPATADELTDAEGRSCVYVPGREDGQVVDSISFGMQTQDC